MIISLPKRSQTLYMEEEGISLCISCPLNFQRNTRKLKNKQTNKQKTPLLIFTRAKGLGLRRPAFSATVDLARMRKSVTITTRRRRTSVGWEESEPSLQMMETQTLPKDEVADAVELELEAVIGFNGETSNVSGLGGLGAPGTMWCNQGQWDTRRHLEGSLGHWHESSTGEPNSLSSPKILESCPHSGP